MIFIQENTLENVLYKIAINLGLKVLIHKQLGPLLLTWFNFNPNMDK